MFINEDRVLSSSPVRFKISKSYYFEPSICNLSFSVYIIIIFKGFIIYENKI